EAALRIEDGVLIDGPNQKGWIVVHRQTVSELLVQAHVKPCAGSECPASVGERVAIGNPPRKCAGTGSQNDSSRERLAGIGSCERELCSAVDDAAKRLNKWRESLVPPDLPFDAARQIESLARRFSVQ